MPAHQRQPLSSSSTTPQPPPRLPNIEENAAAAAPPLSSLFGGSFDRAAVESAAQLADSSIFITASGSRFQLVRLPEPAGERRSPQLNAAGWGGGGSSSSSSGGGGSRPAPASSGTPRAPVTAAAAPVPTTSHQSYSRPQPRPQQRQQQQQQQQPYQPSPPPTQPPTQPLPPTPVQDARFASTPTTLPIRSREYSPATSRSSPALSSHGRTTLASARGGWEPQKSLQQQPQQQQPLQQQQRYAQDVDDPPRMMANLSGPVDGFSASALYVHSDGGVQAAEILTDSDSAGRLESGRGGYVGYDGPPPAPARYSPARYNSLNRGIVSDPVAPGQLYRRASYSQEPSPVAPPQRPVYYQQPQPPPHQSPPQQQGYPFPHPQDPSNPISYPVSYPINHPVGYPPIHHPSSPYSSSSNASVQPHALATTSTTPFRDLSSPPPRPVPAASSAPAFTNPDSFSPPAYAYSHETVGAAPTAVTAQAAMTHHGFGGFSSYPPEKPGMVPRSHSLPSLMEESSPVFFTPPPPAPGSLLPGVGGVGPGLVPPSVGDYNGIDTLTPVVVRVHSPPSTATQQTPDNSSATRDNVLPGEDVLYDGFVKSAHALSGPFEEGHLKVFRNNLTHDLRFHCKAGNNTDTHWIKGTKAQMVPVYAYDQRSHHLVFIRDNDGEKRYASAVAQPVLNGPSAIYQFAYLQDLFKFQSQLTGESVVLDISSAKWIRLARANSRDSNMYSSVRLQIWHEPRSRKTMQSDQASFVTAGTALSGPLRERTVPNSSRLMVFLGRSEEYITAFITDDIEMEPKGSMSVRLKPRKYSGVHKRNSKAGIKARLERKTANDPAGLSIHGEPFNPDVEQCFDEYKTFEIEFESSPSQVNFVQAWNEVIEERRKQRQRLAKIQEEMRKETFSPKEALAIIT